MVALKSSVLGLWDYSLLRKRCPRVSPTQESAEIIFCYLCLQMLTYVYMLLVWKHILVLILKHMLLTASIFFFNAETVHNLRPEE